MKSRKRGLGCSRARLPSLSSSGSRTNIALSQVVPDHEGNMTVLHQDYFPETLASLATSLLPKSTSGNQQCPEQAVQTRRSTTPASVHASMHAHSLGSEVTGTPGLWAAQLLGTSPPWDVMHSQCSSEVRSPDFGVRAVQPGQVTSVSTANAKNNRSYPGRAAGVNGPLGLPDWADTLSLTRLSLPRPVMRYLEG